MAKADEVMLGFPGVYAGAIAFPFLGAVVAIPVGVVSGVFGFIDLVGIVLSMLGFGVVGLLIVGPVGLVCFGIVISFDYAFGNVMSSRSASIAAGGLTGFVCTAGPWSWFEPTVLVLAIPAIAVGQFFTARFFDDNNRADLSTCRPDWWRYDIGQIMTATAWIAVFFAITRLIPNGLIFFGAGAAIWIALHVVLLQAGRVVLWLSGKVASAR